MKNRLFLTLVALTLISCGSAEKKSELTKEIKQEPIEADELAWIKNSDFEPRREIPFEASKDNFRSIKVKNDILIKESVARLPDPIIESALSSQDPLSAITKLCYQKKFIEAQKISQEKYESYKSHASYWNQVGTCYLHQGEYRKAELYYQKSRDLNHRYAPPVNNLGVLYQREGDDQKALKAYEEAAKLGAFSVTPMFNLSQLYMRYGLIDRASELLGSLYSMNNRDVDVLSALGSLNLLANNLEKAEKYFSEIPNDALKRADLSLNYAIVLKLSGNKTKAVQLFRAIDKGNLNVPHEYFEQVENYIGM